MGGCTFVPTDRHVCYKHYARAGARVFGLKKCSRLRGFILIRRARKRLSPARRTSPSSRSSRLAITRSRSCSTTDTTPASIAGTICASWRVNQPCAGAAERQPSEARENRARDVALEALQSSRDFGDVPHPRAVPPRGDNRRAHAGRNDVSVGALQRRRRVVDDYAVVALGVLRQRQEFLGAQ